MKRRGSFARALGMSVLDAYKKFSSENGSIKAAALSFYAFLSVFPLLLLAVSVFGFVLGSSEKAYAAVTQFFNSFLPKSNAMIDISGAIVGIKGAAGIIGVASLLWAGSQFFSTLKTLLDSLFGGGEPVGFFRLHLKAIGAVFASGIFLLLSIASTATIGLLRGFSNIIPDRYEHFLISTAALLLGMLFSIAMFFAIYRLLPENRPKSRSALVGAVVAGIFWSVAKELYRVYLSGFANYDAVYGPLGGLVIFVLWIYYSSTIMLLGGFIAYSYDERLRAKA